MSRCFFSVVFAYIVTSLEDQMMFFAHLPRSDRPGTQARDFRAARVAGRQAHLKEIGVMQGINKTQLPEATVQSSSTLMIRLNSAILSD